MCSAMGCCDTRQGRAEAPRASQRERGARCTDPCDRSMDIVRATAADGNQARIGGLECGGPAIRSVAAAAVSLTCSSRSSIPLGADGGVYDRGVLEKFSGIPLSLCSL